MAQLELFIAIEMGDSACSAMVESGVAKNFDHNFFQVIEWCFFNSVVISHVHCYLIAMQSLSVNHNYFNELLDLIFEVLSVQFFILFFVGFLCFLSTFLYLF